MIFSCNAGSRYATLCSYVLVQLCTCSIALPIVKLSISSFFDRMYERCSFLPQPRFQPLQPPAVAATPSLTRLDPVIRGGDNQIYHMAFNSGTWAANWDTSNRTPSPTRQSHRQSW